MWTLLGSPAALDYSLKPPERCNSKLLIFARHETDGLPFSAVPLYRVIILLECVHLHSIALKPDLVYK